MSVQDMGGQFALDMQGLNRLKHTARQDPSQGVRGAAEQFEALFIQMMLKSMRDTIPQGGLMESQATDFYQSMLDQQWSQVMASRGIGLADKLVAQLERSGMVPELAQRGSAIDELIAGIPRGAPRPLQDALLGEEADSETPPATVPETPDGLGPRSAKAAETAPASFMEALEATPSGFMGELAAQPLAAATSYRDSLARDVQSRAADGARAPGAVPRAPAESQASSSTDSGQMPSRVQAFVDKLEGPAHAASRQTGVPAELILAQAALETGWGRHEIATADGRNSHNLFGIKAGSRWQGPTTEVVTHEYLNGQRTRVTDTFRVYGSFEASFTDYARLISDNPRYAGVVTAGSAEQAARALQAGGYATDPAYADKLIAVMGTLNGASAVAGSGGAAPSDSLVFLRY
ncbi:MAG: flagellar assembly peptidoglycan hydrolase FlgJ [Halomonas sp.]|uniref:flagellar assembly peptidoglycan hydrolase FlgJ n=1 Tax=Halomonas sp. TaxID=1486246 RepID=UPI0019DE4411|nr:flagellar assembly peptidoglycan hydrolase FlgJ [Halomonas sp.]MBE0489171.1 flagellar assembly peptidoglycan hydrolase FlgJ [Halomonas sp.]